MHLKCAIWDRAIDYAGPFLGKMFLILVNADSEWIDAYPGNAATTSTTLECLKNSFRTNGIPEIRVSDNS